MYHMKYTYSFLKEAAVAVQTTAPVSAPTNVNQQQKPPESQKKPTFSNPKAAININFNQVFKPFKASSLPFGSRVKTMQYGKEKLYQINRIAKSITDRSKVPTSKNADKNKTNMLKYKLQLKYCSLCYMVHHEFITKMIYFTSKVGGGLNDPRAQKLTEEYTRKLFVYEQAFLRESNGLSVANIQGY